MSVKAVKFLGGPRDGLVVDVPEGFVEDRGPSLGTAYGVTADGARHLYVPAGVDGDVLSVRHAGPDFLAGLALPPGGEVHVTGAVAKPRRA